MRQGQKGGPVPVQSDNAKVEDPIDGEVADSDQQLGKHWTAAMYNVGTDYYIARDEKEAIDKSNIIEGGRTRGAKPEGTYQEPGDEEGLPADNGKSAIAQ
jgi:hypothetical protein